MGIWVELRCERRGDGEPKARGERCWSDDNNGPGEMAGDTQASVINTYHFLHEEAIEAGWKLFRGEGWVCPCCLKYETTATEQEGNHTAIVAAAEKLVRCKGRYHSEQNYRALAALFGVTVPDLEPLAGDGNCLAVPNGWKLVPVAADQNMIDAAYRALDAGVFPGGVYADMIANAPLPPVPGGDHG